LRKASQSAGVFLQKTGSFCLLARRPLISETSTPQLKITATTAVTFAVFAVSLAISSAFVVSLRAVSKILSDRAYETSR
jgi:hypothetical protein